MSELMASPHATVIDTYIDRQIDSLHISIMLLSVPALTITLLIIQNPQSFKSTVLI